MGKTGGFLEFERQNSIAKDAKERILDYNEFHTSLPLEKQKEQAARCNECGVPFCQAGITLKGMSVGCPLNNLIPEFNDLLYRGNLELAYQRLHKTSNFPEFTCRVCPALCEKACTCGLNGDAVSTRENEMTIIEYAYANGLANAKPPINRTNKRIAVIGSGPAGLAVSDQLNQRGHYVDVYERSDKVGGLLRYGIPNMKLEKQIIDRKINVMEAEGVSFKTSNNIGKDVSTDKIIAEYDAVVLACGASNPRDLKVEGRDAKGIYFAVDFLTSTTKSLFNDNLKEGSYISAKDKDVLVIGGGDTGNDCVGTCIRHKCKSLKQLEMMPKAPDKRSEDNPWPQYPRVNKTDYGQEEAIAVFGEDPRLYLTTVKKFKKDALGNLIGATLVNLEFIIDENNRRKMVEVEGSEKEVKCQLVLIAAGFLGSESYISDAFNVELDNRTNINSNNGFKTNVEKVFACGDAHTGQSLVVKAIRQGRDCAKEVDEYLMGYSNL